MLSMKGVNRLTKRIPCYVIEDLLPLYIEGEVGENTKKDIAEHLKGCEHCREIYRKMSSSVFQQEDIDEASLLSDYSADKTFLLRAKKAVISLGIITAFLFLTFTSSSFLLGKTKGEYSERFKLAEKYDVFLKVNATKEFDGHDLTLSKVLIDNSLTSIILQSDLDLSFFDSITLKDNNEQFYRRAFLLFENGYYQNSDSTYTLDFVPARPETEFLILELIKFYNDDSCTSITFEIPLENKNKISPAQDYFRKYFNLIQTEISGIDISLISLEQGISHTGLELALDYSSTIYDGVSFGWYPAEGMKNLAVLDLIPGENSSLEILSIEDITIEELISATDKTTIPRQTNKTYRIIGTPLPEDTDRISLQLHNLFAFTYIHHFDIELDFSGNNTIKLDKTFSSDHYNVSLKSAVKDKDIIKLYYEIRDKNNRLLPEHLLDARIRVSENIYDVPVQGRSIKENTLQYVEFKDMGANRFILELLRTGKELQSGPHFIELDK